MFLPSSPAIFSIYIFTQTTALPLDPDQITLLQSDPDDWADYTEAIAQVCSCGAIRRLVLIESVWCYV